MSKNGNYFPRLALFFLILIAAVLAQWKFKIFLGWTPNFVLAILVSLSFFTDFWSIVFLSLFAVWALGWPVVNPEMIFLFLLPLAVFGLKNIFPYHLWINNLIFIFAGSVLFYFIGSGFLFLDQPAVFALSLVGSLLAGAAVFASLYFFRSVKN